MALLVGVAAAVVTVLLPLAGFLVAGSGMVLGLVALRRITAPRGPLPWAGMLVPAATALAALALVPLTG